MSAPAVVGNLAEMNPANGSNSEARLGQRHRTVPCENIRFNEAKGQTGFTIREDSKLVNIYPTRSHQKLPESKMKIRKLVDYTWDVLYGNGRLVATHVSKKFLAYSLRVDGSVGKVSGSGGIRIVDIETNDRILIKGSRGMIKDLEFMYKVDDLIIGFVDDYGTVYIYKITKEIKSGLMQTYLILEITMGGKPTRSDFRRFVWCKFVPDDNIEPLTSKDGAYHFAVLQNNEVYVANVCQLVEKRGEGHHNWSDFEGSFMKIRDHSDTVMDASFAPDGTALATASEDGTVKFFQIYVLGNEPSRCLYSWAPHNGRPVTKIFFLDDHNVNESSSEGQFWKYMITAGPNMSEMKLWSCKEWVCLQTLKFCCPSPSQLKMDLHSSAKFLMVADVHRKSMFVVNVVNNEVTARFNWITEFSLPCSIISFNLTNTRLLTLREIEAGGYEDYVNEVMNPCDNLCIVDVSFVQPKSLQQGTVAFLPPKDVCTVRTPSPSRIRFDPTIAYTQQETEVEHSATPDESSSDGEDMNLMIDEPSCSHERRSPQQPRTSSPKPKQKPTLSTMNLSQQLSNLLLSGKPSFNGGVKVDDSPEDRSNVERAKSPSQGNAGASGLNNVSNMLNSQNIINVVDDNIRSPGTADHAHRRSSSRSSNASRASSSPSREVEEILSPKTELGNRKSNMSQPQEPCFKESNYDTEGNVMMSNDIVHPPPPPFKAELFSPRIGGDTVPHMPIVLQQVGSIMDMMQAQAQEMKELKREVSRLNTAQVTSSRQLDEAAMSRILDNYFSTNNYQVQRLEECVKNILVMERQRPSSQALPPNFGEVVTSNIAKLIKMQMESTILPNIVNIFEPVRSQVQAELVKLVLNAEGRIKQEIKQLLQSQDFQASISTDLETNMKSTCESVMPRVLLTSIIPNFEKSLQSLYVKINDTFLKGTKEYIGGLEGTLRREASSQEELKDHLSSMQDNISSVLQVELESQMMRVLNNLQSTLVKQIEETVGRELNRAFRDQQKFLESSILSRAGAVTPALSVSEHNTSFTSPQVDPETLLRQLFAMVDRGDIVGAFTQASHYSDITYLMKLAEKVNPSQVFTPKLPAQTLVSIIQQMATINDLSSFTETKIMYLSCAMSTISTTAGDRKVLKSLSRILPVFVVAVRKYSEQHPGSPNLQQLKLIEMAFNGICSQAQSMFGPFMQ